MTDSVATLPHPNDLPFSAPAAEPEWLSSLRRSAWDRFERIGWPTLADEDWRFTNLNPLKQLSLTPSRKPASPVTREAVEARSLLKGIEAVRLIFVDGYFAPELSDRPEFDHGIHVASLGQALGNSNGSYRPYLTAPTRPELNAFAALNTAWFADGVAVSVPPRQTVSLPILAIFAAHGAAEGPTTNPRNFLRLQEGSSATFIEEHVSLNETPYLTNAVTECLVGEQASVEHLKIQDQSPATHHLATFHAWLEQHSRLSSHSLALGARLARNDLRVKLEGEGAECVLNGLYLTDGQRLADHHMVVDHVAPRCQSHEYFNGILSDRSRGVFHGRILVQQEAQKTDAKQTSKSLLLSDEAVVNTKPQLEIYADDVKCTHGATIGQMDEEAIFYLRARGIPLPVAQQIIQLAFAEEIVERIQERAVRQRLADVVQERLKIT